MSEMTQGVMARPDQDRPSYLSRGDHGDAPDTMPEVARELTMLRGAVISADKALHEAFEEFEHLLMKLQPVVDQRPKPTDGMALRDETVQRAPDLATGVGGDVRQAYEHVGTIEAQLHTLGRRIRNLRNEVAL